VALYDFTDELDDLVLPGDAHVAVLVGIAPVLEAAVARQLVEMGARRQHRDLRVAGGIARHLDLRQLHAPGLRISPGPQVEPQHQLQPSESGHLVEEASRAQFDQLFGALRHRQAKRIRADRSAPVRPRKPFG
jgi:uncharacterized protein YjeT (DUF2065 family)